MKCENCGHVNREGAQVCDVCGHLFVDVAKDAATKALGETDIEEIAPKWGSARFTQRIQLIINVDGTDKRLTIETHDIDELVIGRTDPDTHQSPPIDLTDFGAVDKGVSRRHAAIVRKDGSLHVVDKGSPNGTFLNGQKLVTNQPRVLRDGDDIRLGFLVMRVAFERNNA
jgi:hypothetical protein